jgi:hypothetical protein
LLSGRACRHPLSPSPSFERPPIRGMAGCAAAGDHARTRLRSKLALDEGHRTGRFPPGSLLGPHRTGSFFAIWFFRLMIRPIESRCGVSDGYRSVCSPGSRCAEAARGSKSCIHY